MAGRIDLILDGGPADVGLESTVLDLSRAVPTVLRLGGLDLARLRAVAGPIAVLAGEHEGEALPSPGLARRHYAPKARLEVVGDIDAAIARQKAGTHIGVLALGPAAGGPGVVVEAMPVDPARYGARLYAALHEMDARGVAVLLVEAPPEDEAWGAVADRLRRATAEA